MQYSAYSFTSCQVLNTVASYEYQKSEHIQQWNVFKCQTYVLFFNILSKFIYTLIDTRWSDRMRDSTQVDCCDRCISRQNNTSARSFFINDTFSATSELLTLYMYCWSYKTLVTTYWTHLRVNGIWVKFFCPQKMNDWQNAVLQDVFNNNITIFIIYILRHNDFTVIKLTAVTQN